MNYQNQDRQEPRGAYYIQPTPVIVYQATGNCPHCQIGVLRSETSCLGILCCILFFPLGLLCLLTLQDERCSNCGYVL